MGMIIIFALILGQSEAFLTENKEDKGFYSTLND